MNPIRSHATVVFEASLVLASVVPFICMVGAQILWPQAKEAQLNGLQCIFIIISLLNLMHVASTVYLYTDPIIARQARTRSGNLIVVPLAIIAASTGAFGGLAWNVTQASNWLLIVLTIGYLHWLLWHFGMQNYGVHSFVSMTSLRPKRTTGQARFEKLSIRAGAIAGMLSLWQYAPFTSFVETVCEDTCKLPVELAETAYLIGGMVYVSLFTAAAIYVLRQRAKFTVNSALIFLVSVGFFVPNYLGAFGFAASHTDDLGAFRDFSVTHGIQYFVFLTFHMVGRVTRGIRENARLEDKIIRALLPILCFGVVALWLSYYLMKHFFFAVLVWYGATDSFEARKLGILVLGFNLGITMAHFWVDQSVWKLSRPDSREWIFERYGYVLPKAG